MTSVVVLALVVATGFTALVYEVVWQRFLGILLGADSEASTAILALFLGGLASGYAAFGRLAAHPRLRGDARRLLVVCGAAEAFVGVWALAFPALFAGIRALGVALGPEPPLARFGFDVGLVAVLVLPPTVAMGATVPLLTQALAERVDRAVHWNARLYGFNSLGAVAGALAAGFVLLPWLGLDGTGAAMGTLNLIAGAGLCAAGFTTGERTIPIVSGEQTERPGQLFVAAAFGVGFAVLVIQTVMLRLAGLSLGTTQFAFSMVVALFVAGIASGSLIVSLLGRIPAAALPTVLWVQLGWWALLYVGLDAMPYWAHALRNLFRSDPSVFVPYQVAVFSSLALVFGPPVALSGSTLPLIFHELRRDAEVLGPSAGRVYAWNTIGSVAGALLGGHLLLLWLDLHQVFRIALGALALSAVLVSIATSRVPRGAAAGLGATSLLAIALLGGWSPERLASGLFRVRVPTSTTFSGPTVFFDAAPRGDVLFYEDDPVASVAVKERPGEAVETVRAIITNGRADGSTSADYPTMAIASMLPAMLAERAESAFVIGFGTGVSAGELAALDSMRRVVVAEISPAVIEAAAFFETMNQGVLASPKVEVLRGDAYRLLSRSDERFDVIVSEPSHPWVLGVEMLYTREFLETARSRLAPGGVHAQWIHAYESDLEVVSAVLRTYTDVFPYVSVWYALGMDLLLLGRVDPPGDDLARILERGAQPDYAAGLTRGGVPSATALLAHELLPLGVVHALDYAAPAHTLLKPRLGYLAARAQYAGRFSRLPPSAQLDPARYGAEASLLRRHLAAAEPATRPSLERGVADEICSERPRECATFLASLPRGTREEIRAGLPIRVYAGELVTHLARLDALALLQGGSMLDGPMSLERAMQLTELYQAYYFHGAPFRRSALAEIWLRCQAPEGACEAAHRHAESRLGPFGE